MGLQLGDPQASDGHETESHHPLWNCPGTTVSTAHRYGHESPLITGNRVQPGKAMDFPSQFFLKQSGMLQLSATFSSQEGIAPWGRPAANRPLGAQVLTGEVRDMR